MEPPSSPPISVTDETGRNFSVDQVQNSVTQTFRLHQTPIEDICVLLTSDESIRSLNRRFRQVDSATDVLTFPGDSPGEGNIAISVPYAERQAALRGVELDTELCYLAIHGALHLLGFDDQSDDERSRMMAEMNRVAVSIGLPADQEWSSILHEIEGVHA